MGIFLLMPLEIILNNFISLLILTGLEIVLGVDNLILVALLSNQLPRDQQKYARQFGLLLALAARLLLLFGVVWLTHLTQPLVAVYTYSFSINDLLMIGGGMFLIFKGAQAISDEFEKEDNTAVSSPKKFSAVIFQIVIFDLIFSLDSILTAVGLVKEIWIMAVAISIAILAMILASDPLSTYVKRHPSIRMLALSFLLLIGTVLVADGLHFHIPRGYIYFSLFFSSMVIGLNILASKKK